MNKTERNIAFVDGQNLYLGTTKHPDEPWQVDLARFRVYLEKKYGVTKAYYYFGYMSDEHRDVYDEVQEAGFVVRFRKHVPAMKSLKKGNVDTEIIFEGMYRLYKQDDFEKVVLVSGDGDYYRMVKFLLDEKRLEKVLFPNEYASSLYKQYVQTNFCANLSQKDVRKKIRKGTLR